MQVITVSGQARFGKDVVSDYIAYKINYKRIAFASNVKKIFCETFDVDMEFIEKWKVISEPPPGFDMPVRQALQFIGDGFRKIKSDIWIDLIFRKNPTKVIVSDGRYINELKRTHDNNGINILLWRPGFENNDPNQSESQIKSIIDWHISKNVEGDVRQINRDRSPEGCGYIDYFIINNGTLDTLYKKIEDMVLKNINL